MSHVSDSTLGSLEAHISRRGETVTLALAGEFDLASVETVREKLAEACSDAPSQVVIDLRELTFIDSTGISFLLSTVKADEMRRLAFIGCDSPAVQRVLTITGVAGLFSGAGGSPLP
ncbi:MAG TPA: STAS domain-containing protein [Solirubrobacterales bacterium]|nr:STAS domain-containing protein [Solirubrobacterales bacterium]